MSTVVSAGIPTPAVLYLLLHCSGQGLGAFGALITRAYRRLVTRASAQPDQAPAVTPTRHDRLSYLPSLAPRQRTFDASPVHRRAPTRRSPFRAGLSDSLCKRPCRSWSAGGRDPVAV